MPTPPLPTRPLNVTLVKNVESVKAGVCYLGVANAFTLDGVDYIVVANTNEQLEKLASMLETSHPLPPHKFIPVAVVHEGAVILEDDEL